MQVDKVEEFFFSMIFFKFVDDDVVFFIVGFGFEVIVMLFLFLVLIGENVFVLL